MPQICNTRKQQLLVQHHNIETLVIPSKKNVLANNKNERKKKNKTKTLETRLVNNELQILKAQLQKTKTKKNISVIDVEKARKIGSNNQCVSEWISE